MLETRSTHQEIMDDLSIEGEVINQTLRELDFINQWLGGNSISILSFRKLLKHNIKSVADLGCGSADILVRMAKMARKLNRKVSLTGIDANPAIAAYAKSHTRTYPEIEIESLNIFSDEFARRKFDVIHCCLFLHHFTEDELVTLFALFKKQVTFAVIVNDLHRHFLAFYSIRWLTGLFSKSYMVKNDASLSVARGFKRAELIRILQKSGVDHYTLRWRWAFRWQLIIHLSKT